jgi:predicted nucleic acid-binding protein
VGRREDLWVLDTSIAIAWFFVDEPFRREALSVRQHVRDEPRRFLVPPLFHAELVHTLARKSERDVAFVEAGLATILRLGIRSVLLTEGALLRTADWSCRGLSGYHATFVALAEDLGARWLTAEERAAKLAGPAALALRSWNRSRGGRRA